MKATYARGVLVETHFEKFSINQGNMAKTLQSQQFERALVDIDINWDNQSLMRVYSGINKSFNSKVGFGASHQNQQITAAEVD